ncbi:T9SS type A sorting domain-containing protein [bacterium]|nr:T9SS type A sorting domain-containing protein [bacterium]
MKKIIIALCCLLLVPAITFGVNFSPTPLRLSAPAAIQYNFDGSNLVIPLTVTGTPAYTIFTVYTKDKGEDIGEVTNGYLGWHYVNRIDTCVYLSTAKQFDVGKQTISWDGKDNDGGKVPAGEYTYYLWAFDNTNLAKRATDPQIVSPSYMKTTLWEVGENGMPLQNPFITLNTGRETGIGKKWILGGDPDDPSLVETTDFAKPVDWQGRMMSDRIALNPTDYNTVYISAFNFNAMTKAIWQYKWVPNGTAERNTDWGVEIKTPFDEGCHGMTTDRTYLYTPASATVDPDPYAKLAIIDFDGELIADQTLEMYIKVDDFTKEVNPSTYQSGGPGWLDTRDNKLFMGYWFCLFMAADPYRYLDGSYEDLTLWMNGNGDYVNDTSWEVDSTTPWLCFTDSAPWRFDAYVDANEFYSVSQCGMGAVSFSVMGPDGSGVGLFTYAGDSSVYKFGPLYCQNGSTFDGMYINIRDQGDGLWFLGHDSMKGIITSNPINVEEAGPVAFDVSQNTPNPFNPTTMINFIIPEAGNVSIDVFNIAGQKVSTIANEFMSSGSHSVTWNASGYSAGVYFYTVKCGDYSRTMKMTLLK